MQKNPPMAYSPWAQCELDFLRDNAGKMELWQIADKLGRSQEATRRKAIRIGCGERAMITRKTESRRKHIAANQHKTTEQLARELRVTRGTVNAYLRKINGARLHRRDPQIVAAVCEKYRVVSASVLAQRHSISRNAVIAIWRDKGLSQSRGQ